jgi:hypothetical protein
MSIYIKAVGVGGESEVEPYVCARERSFDLKPVLDTWRECVL